MRKSLFALAAILAATLAFAPAAVAQQYKWVDKNGRTQYGDSPPPGVKATPLRAPPGPAAQPSSAAGKGGPMTPAEQEADFRKRKAEAEKAQQKQAAANQEAAAKKDNCENAQAYLRTLEEGQRIARTDAKGERYFLEDAQIAQEKVKARQAVQSWCG